MSQGANCSGQLSVIGMGSGRRNCEGIHLNPFLKANNHKDPEMQWTS